MRVRELIEQLQKVNGDMQVLTDNGLSYGFPSRVYTDMVEEAECAIIDLTM